MTDFAPLEPPHGSLTLQFFEPLLLAELVVLRAAANGEIARVGYRQPRAMTPDVMLRAEFLAFLARGGDADAVVARRNLQIMGACIVGRTNLADATVPMSLWFYRCSFTATPVLEGAHVAGSLTFCDTLLPGLRAEALVVDDDLALSAGTQVEGEIKLARARVGRHLDANRLRLWPSPSSGRSSLDAEGLQVSGDIRLNGGAETFGELRFVGARIGGSLEAGRARLTADVDEYGARGVALNLDRASIGANLALDNGFTAVGTVRLQRAQIGGDLDASGAEFDAIGDASWDEHGSALRLDRARIDGALILRDLQGPLQGATLVDTRVGTLSDDAGSWGQRHALDGFTYTRFGPGAPVDARTRLSWLARQVRGHHEGDDRPDPWHRLVQTLRRTGHTRSAADVAIGREHHLRRIGHVGSGVPRPLRWAARLGHDAWGLVAGYGWEPWRLLVVAAATWAVFTLACWWLGHNPGDLAALASTGGACRIDAVSNLAGAAVHSLQALLPIASPAPVPTATGIECAAADQAIRLLAWAERACGWGIVLAWLAGWWRVNDRDRGLA